MMLMVLVFFIATDMKIKVLGELDFVSCFFIAKSIISLTSHQKKPKCKASLAIFLSPSKEN